MLTVLDIVYRRKNLQTVRSYSTECGMYCGLVVTNFYSDLVMKTTPSNKCAAANRRYASPIVAGLQFGRAFHSPPCLSADVAALGLDHYRYEAKE